MRLFLLSVAACLLTTGTIAVACTTTDGAPRANPGGEWVVQTAHKPMAQSAARPPTKASTGTEPSPPSTPVEDADVGGDAAAGSLRIAVVSDLNGSYGSTEYGREVHAAVQWLVDDIQPDVVLSTGDMVAGQRQGLDYEAMWAAFHAAVTRPLSRAGIPMAVTPGNHDASAGADFLGERMTFVEQWLRHRPEVHFVDDSFYPLYYAFEMGPALFISLDATMTGPIDAEQRHWLRDVLDQHRDKSTKVVFGHVPLFPFTKGRVSEVLADDKLEALLDEFDVDLMLSGHHHAYYPGQRSGLRLVGMACLGAGARTLVGADQPSQKSVAVIDVSGDGDISVDAYDPLEHTKIDRNSLPKYLNDGNQRIWRDDLDTSQL